MIFGDVSSTGAWKDDPRIELHGPGYSKIVIGEDAATIGRRHLDVIVALDGRERRALVRQRLGRLGDAPRRRDRRGAGREAREHRPARRGRPEALLAPFADPQSPSASTTMIERRLAEPGARDVTAAHRGGERLARREGCAYLLPTVVRLRDGRAPAGEPRVPVPVRERRRGQAGRDSRGARPEPRRHGHHGGRGA